MSCRHTLQRFDPAKGRGEITPTEVFDASGLLDLVRFDGSHFFQVSDGRILSRPPDLAFAAIFEVGRFMRR